MPKITSCEWDEGQGICRKHPGGTLPCEECLVSHDESVRLEVTRADERLSESDPSCRFGDTLPSEHVAWLLCRVAA